MKKFQLREEDSTPEKGTPMNPWELPGHSVKPEWFRNDIAFLRFLEEMNVRNYDAHQTVELIFPNADRWYRWRGSLSHVEQRAKDEWWALIPDLRVAHDAARVIDKQAGGIYGHSHPAAKANEWLGSVCDHLTIRR